MSPLLYLTWCSFKNRIVQRVRRLREPRYLLGLVAGCAYLYFVMFRNMRRPGRRGGLPEAIPDVSRFAALMSSIGATVVWFLALLSWMSWVWSSNESPIKFTGAEVQFLRTAPLTRRQVVRYKLLRAQSGLLLGVVMAILFSGAWRFGSARLPFVLGGWVIFATIWLHSMGARLTLMTIRRPWSSVPKTSWVAVSIVASVSVLIVTSVARLVGDAVQSGGASVEAGLRSLGTTGLAAVAYWPFRAVVRPAISGSLPAMFAALPTALIILALCYEWVMRADAAAEASESQTEPTTVPEGASRQRQTLTPVLRGSPFSLAPMGRPETAVLWKNLVLLGRYASPRMVIQFLIPLVVLAVVIGLSNRGGSGAPLVLAFAVMTTVVGPYAARNDLRHDMPRLAVIKTWPVPGWSLVLGEILAPTCVLCVVAWFFLACALGLSARLPLGGIGIGMRVAIAVAGAVVAPPLILGQLLVQNAAVVLFPGWIPTGGSRPRGIEAMGQNLVMFAGTLLALALGLVPALLVAGGAGFAIYLLVGLWAVLPAAALFVGVGVAEAALAVMLLGRLIDRTEPSAVEGTEI